MSEEKKSTINKEQTEEKKVSGKKKNEVNSTEKESLSASLKVEKKSTKDKSKTDTLGLEELPEDIKKKLEKKKAENEQKAKKSKSRKKKKKVAKNVSSGRAYIKATYNNTIVTLTDLQGNVIAWASAGVAGFKGPKKSTPYAASIITRIAVGKAKEECGLSEVSVFVRGVGTGRESAIRSLNSNGLLINSIKDITPIPHNGCRAKRPRRV